MALAPEFVIVPTGVTPARFNLLDSVGVKPGGDHAGMGVEYDTEFCGVARPFSPMCVTPDLGFVTIFVDDASVASITSTGLPDGTYRIVWGDGQEEAAEAEQLNDTHDYSSTTGDGTYVVQVYKNGGGLYDEITITVEDGVESGPFEVDAVETKIADDGITTVVGEPFPIYHYFSCRALGHDLSDFSARALRSLDLGASRAVEEGFQTVFGTAAVDITPSGTAVNVVKGLALLEQYAGENYGGRPVIHMDRAYATLLIADQAVFQVGDHLETGLGSLVVAGAGYDAHASLPSAPAAGAGWMYATGDVKVWWANEVVGEPVQATPYANEFKALAERTYVPTFECFHAAVEVTETP